MLTGGLCLLHAQNAAPPQLGSVAATVVNSVTKQPVAQAQVSLQNVTVSRPPLMVTTGRDGRAEFHAVPTGQYRIPEIKASHFTFDAFSAPLLTVTEVGTQVTLMVIPTGEIQGTVLNEDGKPAIRAAVTAHHYIPSTIEAKLEWVQAGFAQTDSQGHYRIQDLAPGRYIVLVGTALGTDVPQLQRTYYPSTTDPAQALRFDIADGGIVDRVDFRLRPAALFHARGRVLGTRERAGTVLVQDCTTTQSSFVSFANVTEDGTFDAAALRPGSYCVNFQERAAGKSALAFATAAVTIVDRDVDNVNLIAAPPQEIDGTITVEDGASFALPSAVSLLPIGPFPAPPLNAKVDAKTGRFHLIGLFPSDYRIGMLAPAGSYVKSIRAGAADFSSGVFNPTRAAGNLTIQIAAARASLTGRVNNGTDKPAARLTVTVFPENHRPDLTKTMQTDERGQFAVNALAPGNYRVLAWESYELLLARAPEFLSQFSGTSVKLTDGETLNVEVRMIPAQNVQDVKSRF